MRDGVREAQGRRGVPLTTAKANRSLDAGPGCRERFRVRLGLVPA